MLTGTLPHLSQQNVFLGVPLLLMPEEVVFLVQKGLACLVDDKNAHYDPDLSQLAKWDSFRLKAIKHQLALAEEEQEAKEHQYAAMTEEAIRKRSERERKKAGAASSPNDPSRSFMEPVENSLARDSHTTVSDAQRGQEPSGASNAGITGASYTVQVTAPSSQLEWYQQSLHSFSTLSSARQAGVWDYPSTPEERARCAVFRDLREQGYYLGIGVKFGGDYLVYPGDPLRYHSHFVASVIPSPRTPLQPMEIVAHGRLGTGTKKSHLLCEWDEENNIVTYYSIEWASFG
ncbi:tRNA intron endonuclease [Pisolithus marmoratus]|nr:tRNA intron endonuclease [Pisolithus marmoratus]